MDSFRILYTRMVKNIEQIWQDKTFISSTQKKYSDEICLDSILFTRNKDNIKLFGKLESYKTSSHLFLMLNELRILWPSVSGMAMFVSLKHNKKHLVSRHASGLINILMVYLRTYREEIQNICTVPSPKYLLI